MLRLTVAHHNLAFVFKFLVVAGPESPKRSAEQSGANKLKKEQETDVDRERRVRSFVVCLAFIAAALARLSVNHSPKFAMEEAASLFGPPDSASDPFGSLITNGSDDHAASSTSPPSEHPLLETQKVDSGHGWFDGSSDNYQAESSLYPEYEWRNSDDAGGHHNTQPHYEGPSDFYLQSSNAHGGGNLQYTALHDGEWHSL